MSDAATTPRKKPKVPVGLLIQVLILIIGAPFLILSIWVPGAVSLALFGVLAGMFSYLPGNPKSALSVVVVLAVLGMVAVLLHGQTWILAAMLVLLGVGYGFAASKGLGSAVLQIPILVPYFMMSPPPLFSEEPPTLDWRYILTSAVLVILGGAWTIFVLHKATHMGTLKVKPVADPRMPLLYGTLLGIMSAGVLLIVVAVNEDYVMGSHWVWVILTIYVLADPTELVGWQKMGHRILGALIGFTAVTVLILLGLPGEVMSMLALVTLWFLAYWMIMKKPYWQYIIFLTMTVVLMNSTPDNALIMDIERVAFTLIGAGLTILAAVIVNLVFYHRRGVSVPHDDG